MDALGDNKHQCICRGGKEFQLFALLWWIFVSGFSLLFVKINMYIHIKLISISKSMQGRSHSLHETSVLFCVQNGTVRKKDVMTADICKETF